LVFLQEAAAAMQCPKLPLANRGLSEASETWLRPTLPNSLLIPQLKDRFINFSVPEEIF
jgi:hypothetical protein